MRASKSILLASALFAASTAWAEAPKSPPCAPMPIAAEQKADAPEAKAASLKQEKIPFANLGGIRDFYVVDDRTIFLEGRGKQWYKADLSGGCFSLDFDLALAFKTRGDSSFGRLDEVVQKDGRSCYVTSLVKAENPKLKKQPEQNPEDAPAEPAKDQGGKPAGA